MQLPSSTPERLLWLLLLFLLVGYLVGTWLNRSRSKQIGNWLQAGIGKLGGKPGWKILRSVSSGGQVVVTDAAPPFRQVQINWAMLTRELIPLWIYEYLTGKRDLLVVRGVLRSEPDCELEVIPAHGALRRKLDAASTGQPWQWQDGPAGLGIASRGSIDPRLFAAVSKFLERYGPRVQRLSLRPTSRAVRAAGGMYLANAGPGEAGVGPGGLRPHLQLFLSLGSLKRTPLTQLIEATRDIARAA